MEFDQTRFRNLFSLYPISKFVCFESETERNPRMQFFVRNPPIGKPQVSPLLSLEYLGCNTVFDMRLRVTFLRRKTVSLKSNIAHRE
jgi:hypothetical protein